MIAPFAWARRSRQASLACACAVTVLGVALIANRASAALVMTVSGLALLVVREPPARMRRGSGPLLGGLVALGAAALLLYELAGAPANRTGLLVPTGLLLGGLGLLSIDLAPRWRVGPGQPLGLATATLGAMPLVSSFYALGGNDESPATAGSLAFAFALVLLGVGLVLARPRRGIVALFGAADTAGAVLRGALLPAALALVVAGGLAHAAWHRGLLTDRRAIGFLVLVSVAVLVALTWSNAARLRRLAHEQAAAARQQKDLGQQLATVLESIAQGFLAFDRQGRLTHVNRHAARMLHGTPEALLGRRAWELFDGRPDGRLDRAIARAQAEQVPITVEAEYAVLRLWCEIDIVPTASGVILFAQDVTERRRNEQERQDLLESERAARAEAQRASRMKDEFLATVSHELRTPLNAILGWAQVLTRGATEDQLQRGLSAIERNAILQAQLIEDLLDVSRIISGKLRLQRRTEDLAPIVEAAIETVRHTAEEKGVRLAREIDPAAGPVLGDPSRLQQIVWNLLSNAVKFTPGGGEVRVSLARDGEHVRLSISDTGQGIPPELLPQIFGRFWQADASSTRLHGGLGLGLAIVHHLVEQHEGSVVATSEGEGHGSTFTVSLPAAPPREHAVHETAACSGEGPSLEGIHVLLVDDEADSRELIRHVLEQRGAEVREANSAVLALNLFASCRPDVLISDIGMPGTDGYELIGLVRAFEGDTRPRVPAIALTAFARPEDRRRAFLAGFEVHVVKPVIPSELVSTVASMVGRGGAQNSAAS